MGVPFQCCTQLEAMEAAVAIGGGRNNKGGSERRRGLRRLVGPCWSQQQTPPLPTPCVVHVSEEEEEEGGRICPSPIHALPDDLLLDCLARLPRASLQSTMMVCRRWREAVQSPIYLERRRRIGTLESLLMVFGGGRGGVSCAVYSDLAGRWRAATAAVAGGDGAEPLYHAQAAALGHLVFIVGGGTTLVYDSWSESVRRAAPMPLTRKKFACCGVDGRILVAGGRDVSRPGAAAALADALEYIPGEDAWRPIAPMPRGRYACLGVAVAGIFYVIGGLKASMGSGGTASGICMQQPYYTYLSSMELFDAKARAWQKTRPLPTGGCVIACTAVGSCIYMLSSHAVELSLWRYETEAEAWSRMKAPPIPSPLRLDSRLRFACAAVGSCVYLLQISGSIDDLFRRSGRSPRGLNDGLVLLFDTISHSWSRRPDLPSSASSIIVKYGAACAIVVQC